MATRSVRSAWGFLRRRVDCPRSSPLVCSFDSMQMRFDLDAMPMLMGRMTQLSRRVGSPLVVPTLARPPMKKPSAIAVYRPNLPAPPEPTEYERFLAMSQEEKFKYLWDQKQAIDLRDHQLNTKFAALSEKVRKAMPITEEGVTVQVFDNLSQSIAGSKVPRTATNLKATMISGTIMLTMTVVGSYIGSYITSHGLDFLGNLEEADFALYDILSDFFI